MLNGKDKNKEYMNKLQIAIKFLILNKEESMI
jgi:hypothetical protein